MKKVKKLLATILALCLVLGAAPLAFAQEGGGLEDLPAGVYTYVDAGPVSEAGSGTGQVQLLYWEDTILWSFDGQSGSQVLSGDELEFFQGLYLSDRPVTDWLGGATKDVEGYAGEVAGGVDITITEEGKLSKIHVTNPKTRALAIVTRDITDDTLTIQGITRGRPNLLQSCITLMGSTNGLYLTVQGDVVLDGVSIGHNADGVGLKSDKIGGDTFIVGTIPIDGTVEWYNKMGVILPLDSQPGAIVTNGQDITMTGGSNVGRVGRDLTISTGEGLGGNITIGATVSTDSTRGGQSPDADTSKDGMTLNTSGQIIAGLGDVIIGTNTEKAVTIDLIGGIQGNNVTIKPDNRGVPGDVTGAIGSITAAENIEIVIGSVNAGTEQDNTNASQGFTNWESDSDGDALVIGSMTAQNGSITVEAGVVNGAVGDISAPNGSVNLKIESVKEIGQVAGSEPGSVVLDITLAEPETVTAVPNASSVLVNGEAVAFDAYTINQNNYFKLRDLAYILSGTDKQFEVAWDGENNAIVLTSGQAYTAVGGEMEGKGDGEKSAMKSSSAILLDGVQAEFAAYTIDGNNYFKLRDIGQAFDFGVEWDGAANSILIDTTKGYTP